MAALQPALSWDFVHQVNSNSKVLQVSHHAFSSLSCMSGHDSQAQACHVVDTRLQILTMQIMRNAGR